MNTSIWIGATVATMVIMATLLLRALFRADEDLSKHFFVSEECFDILHDDLSANGIPIFDIEVIFTNDDSLVMFRTASLCTGIVQQKIDDMGI